MKSYLLVVTDELNGRRKTPMSFDTFFFSFKFIITRKPFPFGRNY